MNTAVAKPCLTL